MDVFQYLLNILNWQNLMWLTIGSVAGFILGALPGVSVDTGIAIFMPITFNLEPVTGLITLAAIYVCGAYGGNITAVLLNTPGESDALFMVLDGYPMTRLGKGLRAVGITTYSAFFGGMVGGFTLLFVAPALSNIATDFGPLELFLTTLMGIVIIVGLVKDGMVKGLISACLGLLCAMIGMDNISGLNRFSFGVDGIYDALPLLPVVLGMFAISQLFELVASNAETIAIDKDKLAGTPFLTMKEHLSMLTNNIRASIIGTIVGIIPAAGTTVAAGISYSIAKKTDKHPETFGKGNDNGLACVSAANNGVVGGSLVPLLTLGIPGNGTSALFLGGLLIHGLAPGFSLFKNNPGTVYGMFWGLILANFFILLLGLYGAPLYVRVTKVSTAYLVPLIGVLCILGAYTFRNLAFDNYLIIIFGVIGYYMVKANFPMAPFVLAFVLGKGVEMQLRRTITLLGMDTFKALLHPLPMFLLIVDIAFLVMPIWASLWDTIKRKRNQAASERKGVIL